VILVDHAAQPLPSQHSSIPSGAIRLPDEGSALAGLFQKFSVLERTQKHLTHLPFSDDHGPTPSVNSSRQGGRVLSVLALFKALLASTVWAWACLQRAEAKKSYIQSSFVEARRSDYLPHQHEVETNA
jgi:hypothetical protein